MFQQFILNQLLNQAKKNNPDIYQQVINMTEGKTEKEMEKLFYAEAEKRNINPADLMQNLFKK